MKQIKQFFILFLCIVFFSSCEKVIELDLADTEPTIVIEAQLKEGNEGLKVLITKSASFYTSDLPETVEDAIVTLSDDEGNNYSASHLEKGVYLAPATAEAGRTYTLTVLAEDETYIAKSTLTEAVELINLETEFQPATGPIEEGYIVYFRYEDPPEVQNYYRVLHYINGEAQLEGGDLQILNDGRNNGLAPRLPVFQHTFQAGEEITIELISLDREVHDYFNSLGDLIGEGGPGGGTAAPANPKSNWSNNALGYFSAYSSQTLSIMIE